MTNHERCKEALHLCLTRLVEEGYTIVGIYDGGELHRDIVEVDEVVELASDVALSHIHLLKPDRSKYVTLMTVFEVAPWEVIADCTYDEDLNRILEGVITKVEYAYEGQG